jgi:hypothetical protein
MRTDSREARREGLILREASTALDAETTVKP